MIDRGDILNIGQTAWVEAKRLGQKKQEVVIFQIFFDEKSRKSLDPLAVPLFNPTVSKYFENQIIGEVVEAMPQDVCDYLGVFSWKFSNKIPLSLEQVLEMMKDDAFSADVYTFFGAVQAKNIWKIAERKHPGILEAAQVLLEEIGFEVAIETLATPIVYQNHFIAKAMVYQRFVTEMLAPCLRMMTESNNKKLHKLLGRNALYSPRSWSPEKVMGIFSKAHPTLHPFVCERLLSTWLAINSDLSVKHLWSGRFVEVENLAHEPEL